MVLTKRRERQNRAVSGRMRRQMTGSPLPRKDLTMLDENESDEIVFEATSCAIYVQKTQVIVLHELPHQGDRARTAPQFFPRSVHTPRFRHTRDRSQHPQKALAVPYMKHTMSGIEPQK